MRARRFPMANAVYSLVGGTEDNDLWVEQGETVDGTPYLRSVWDLTDNERQEVADGHNICLVVIGTGTPPVQMMVTPEQPGKGEDEEQEGQEGQEEA